MTPCVHIGESISGEIVMDLEREEDLLKLVGSKGTITILRFLNELGSAQYKHLHEFMNEHTLNERLRKLLDFNLINHYMDKKAVRKEWYEITEKGKNILKIMEDMIRLIED